MLAEPVGVCAYWLKRKLRTGVGMLFRGSRQRRGAGVCLWLPGAARDMLLEDPSPSRRVGGVPADRRVAQFFSPFPIPPR